MRALKAALCGPNPQHVIIYGPPGVGKTAAARVVLEEAKKNRRARRSGRTPSSSKIDATTARFDERGIADPLIGSVHDPIYQGAGAMGVAGIPQPKPGAVTKAHGGVLFIDEIGELHPIQMNKLLKVLEDRKVFLESAYYNSEDTNIPRHIHDIFQNGLACRFPARRRHDAVAAMRFRPRSVRAAWRSFSVRCSPEEIGEIAGKAVRQDRHSAVIRKRCEVVKRYATNGREAVNIVQLAGRSRDDREPRPRSRGGIEWVVNSSQISPRPDKKIRPSRRSGWSTAWPSTARIMGTLLEIEVTRHAGRPGRGQGEPHRASSTKRRWAAARARCAARAWRGAPWRTC